MRRAGYEVRVLPEEGASWEENPPTLLEFIRRDLRWAQGNMQYWPFLVMPGLQARQPLPDRLRDADVPRLARLDGPAGARHARGRRSGTRRTSSGPTPAWRCSSIIADHVVRAEDRDRASTCCRGPRCATRSAARRGSSPARHRDDLLPDAVADHVVRPHHVPRPACVLGTHDRLGRAGARRSRGAVARCRAAALAAHAARLELHSRARLHGAVGDSLCAVHRGRTRAVDPARGHHLVAVGRPRADARRHRRAAGGERAARAAAQARAARDRGGGAARRPDVLDALRTAARRLPLAAHLLRRPARSRRDGRGSTRGS